MVQEMTSSHLFSLEDSAYSTRPGLIDGHTHIPAALSSLLQLTFGDAEFKIGRRARFSEWGLVHVGDVVSVSNASRVGVGRVCFACEVHSILFFGISMWQSSIDPAKFTDTWDCENPTDMVVMHDDIVDTLVWRRSGPVIKVIRPC